MLEITRDPIDKIETNPKYRVIKEEPIQNQEEIRNDKEKEELKQGTVGYLATEYLDKFYAWGENHEL